MLFRSYYQGSNAAVQYTVSVTADQVTGYATGTQGADTMLYRVVCATVSS